MKYMDICNQLKDKKMDGSNMVPKATQLMASGLDVICRISGIEDRELLIYEDGNIVYTNPEYKNPTVISIQKYWHHKKEVDELGNLIIERVSDPKLDEMNYEYFAPEWAARVMQFGDGRLFKNKSSHHSIVGYDDLTETEILKYMSEGGFEEDVCNSFLAEELLGLLNQKQRRVIELRYGFDDTYGNRLTFEEIGRIMYEEKIFTGSDFRGAKQKVKGLHDRALGKMRDHLKKNK